MDLEALYPDPDNSSFEMSLEELRAMRRGWMDRERVMQLRKKPALKEKSRIIPFSDASVTTATDIGEDPVNKSLSAQLKDKLVVNDRTHAIAENNENDENAIPEQKAEKAKMKYREVRGEAQTSMFMIP